MISLMQQGNHRIAVMGIIVISAVSHNISKHQVMVPLYLFLIFMAQWNSRITWLTMVELIQMIIVMSALKS